MKITPTEIKGCYIVDPTIYNDSRGYFFESFNRQAFYKSTGIKVDFVQDNQSFSKKGVIRGLHYQTGVHGQTKLVRVVKGNVLDVIVDLRKDSPSFKKIMSIELSEENKKQLFIPKGIAHGFSVLSEEVIFNYKCDNYYNKESERGIVYNDKTLQIDWRVNPKEIIISEKDLMLPGFEEVMANE